MSVVTTRKEAGTLIISVNNPPVNALSQALRQGISEAIATAQSDASKAILIFCEGRTLAGPHRIPIAARRQALTGFAAPPSLPPNPEFQPELQSRSPRPGSAPGSLVTARIEPKQARS